MRKDDTVSTYLAQARAIFDEIVEIRRDIHRHPERGGCEERTSALIRATLEAYGVDSIQMPAGTSVVATIDGTQNNKEDKKDRGKCIALRADMDALPVQEETGFSFASEIPGMMHACGHDVHSAMMLGNAKLLCAMRNEFAGTVKLIFQSSEEVFPGGARQLVDAGVMEGVDAILGMHNFPTENDKVGVIGFKGGPFTASADPYQFDIVGVGGHSSLPHKVPDPVLAAAEMIVMFQQIQARAVAPRDTAIFMMNKIEGGTAPNIIADRVRMSGLGRAYTEEARDKIRTTAGAVAKAVECVSGCTIKMDVGHGYDACFNDYDLSNFLLAELPKIVGADKVETFKDPMEFGEDFSFYSTLTGVPGVLMILQAGYEGDALYTLHNAQCAVKEEAMVYGMAAMTGSAIAFLNR